MGGVRLSKIKGRRENLNILIQLNMDLKELKKQFTDEVATPILAEQEAEKKTK